MALEPQRTYILQEGTLRYWKHNPEDRFKPIQSYVPVFIVEYIKNPYHNGSTEAVIVLAEPAHFHMDRIPTPAGAIRTITASETSYNDSMKINTYLTVNV